MISTFATAGRTILAPSMKCAAPRFATQIVLTSKSANHMNLPVRFFSKPNNSTAGFGSKIRAEPVKTTAERFATMNEYGMAIVGLAGATGIGAMCYYGLGMSNGDASALDRAVMWPQYVKDRIRSTYAHLGVGFAVSVGAAYATFQSPVLMRLFSSGSIMVAIGSMAALIGSSIVVQSIPYEKGFGPKHLAWIVHSSLLGVILAPLSLFGGPALIRAGMYTAGVVGGLSAIAVCAPSERFLLSSAPLTMALGAVVASSIGSMFLPPTTRIGMGLLGISMYGGLLVFSGLLLYDTQKTIKKAETHSPLAPVPYDPINNSMHIYMDIVNIFIRMLYIFGGNQGRKR